MTLDRIGKYRVVGKIGQGAMGEVYKAHDPLLNRYVALKTIAPTLAADGDFRRRFLREAQSAARLNHPNIVTVFDFGEESGLTYMAMELLEGLDLREAIRRRALGHLGRKLEIIEQLCEGLGFAHARGVVHRDLKPGNVHIQPTGHVKVLDFGLARLGVSDMTRTGTVMGTPHYMSPEQVRGEKADARSDVFSLGALFYEILSGQRAFVAASMAEVLQAIQEKDPVPLRGLAPDVPPALVAVVERALAKIPHQRFSDAGEMGQAFGSARQAMAGETMTLPGAGGEAERTVLTGADGTLLLDGTRSAGTTMTGANALDIGAARLPRRRPEVPGTMRPDPTAPGAPATGVPRASRTRILGVVALLVASVVAVGFWLRSRPGPAVSTGDPTTEKTLDLLTETFLMSKVELARSDLEDRDYRAAAGHAREALELDPAYVDALEILEQADRAQKELAAAADEAVAAVERGLTREASAALGRVLALDPRHPVVDRLKSELNRFSRSQAEDARGQVRRARSTAEAARATGEADYRRARGLQTEADGLFQHEQYLAAAQRYLESRNAFEKARSTAEERRASAVPRPPGPRPACPRPRRPWPPRWLRPRRRRPRPPPRSPRRSPRRPRRLLPSPPGRSLRRPRCRRHRTTAPPSCG